MKPVPYVPELHYERVRSWLQARNEDIPAEALPKTGFVVPDKAAGFLYRTDSTISVMETLVAAPGLSQEERSDAIDAVVAALIEEAKKLGFKLLMGYTQLDAVVNRSKKFGFIYVGNGYQCVALPL